MLGGVLAGVGRTELIRYRPRGMRSLAVLLDVNAWAGGTDATAPDARGRPAAAERRGLGRGDREAVRVDAAGVAGVVRLGR